MIFFVRENPWIELEVAEVATTRARLHLLLMSDTELVDLSKATATNPDDKKVIRETIRGKEADITSAIAFAIPSLIETSCARESA